MSSIPLYVDDSYVQEFTAEVVRSGPKYAILDKTAFYPEGGGQPSDTGILKWDDKKVEVFKVLKRGKQIFHYLRRDIPAGVEVTGKIDWDNRFWNMRHHSAEHLLTGLFELEGVGPKKYSSLERLEYADTIIDGGILERVEEKFNRIVDENIAIKIYYQDREEIDVEGDPRKKSFLEKIPRNVNRIRMVEIGEYALTFCMGTHVKSTGEIGHLSKFELEDTRKGRKILHFALEE
jgi:Ser-tRNA(Ala) deacylase AlaX